MVKYSIHSNFIESDRMKIIIANSNPIYSKFSNAHSAEMEVFLITSKEELNIDNVKTINPDYIFFPHWSFYIPNDIYENYKCVVFHMTDLPYGRGGSPLQNLILRGHKSTKLSAIEVVKKIDAGDVYLKEDLSLDGTAREIFLRCEDIILGMIKQICTKSLKPVKQEGEVVSFERRKPEQSNIRDIENINILHDYIRMLDADGYPKAYLETESFRIEFSNSKFNKDEITANVRIFKK